MKKLILEICLIIFPNICLATSYRCVNLLSKTVDSAYFTVSGGQQYQQNMISIMMKTTQEFGVDFIVNGDNIRTGFKIDENDAQIEVRGEPAAVENYLTSTQLTNVSDRRQLVEVADDFKARITSTLVNPERSKEDDPYIEFPISGGNNKRRELLEFMKIVANMHGVKLSTMEKPGDFTNFLFQDGQDIIRIVGTVDNINSFIIQMTETNTDSINKMFSHIHNLFKNRNKN